MKYFLTTLTCVLFAACLQASAQYLPNSLDVSRGKLTDERGIVLSDQQVLEAVGQQIFDETYRGATRQYAAGKNLILGGAIATGAGATVALVSLLAWGDAVYSYVYNDYRYDGYDYHNEGQAVTAALCYYAGALVASAGFTALSAGIVFKSIGRGRLNWIADEYNEHNRPVTMRFGAGQYGTGLVVTF